jgi:ferric-dicitrate binding protein FerR (iron transport regulator)
VELKRGTRVEIAENSSVRFLQEGETVRAELLSGAVISESVGKPTMMVSTPRYQFAPAQAEESRYRVQLSREQAIVAAALEGKVMVKARDASGSYILQEGTYAAISASAAGVPDQASEAGGPLGTQHAGTVNSVVPDGVVQRQGQGAEIPLKVNDRINWEDVVRTLQNGRLRIALAGGSSLNMGTRSTMKIIMDDPQTQQTEIQLSLGTMRVSVVKLTQPGSSFKVQTPTAVTSVVGTDFIVEAQVDGTRVYGIEGVVSVQNMDPAVAGQVLLQPGEFTTVASGLPPSAPAGTPDTLLQSQINQTTVAPGAGGPGGAAAASQGGWQIGSLSEAESIGLAAGAAAGAAAGLAVPLATTSGPAATVSKPKP